MIGNHVYLFICNQPLRQCTFPFFVLPCTCPRNDYLGIRICLSDTQCKRIYPSVYLHIRHRRHITDSAAFRLRPRDQTGKVSRLINPCKIGRHIGTVIPIFRRTADIKCNLRVIPDGFQCLFKIIVAVQKNDIYALLRQLLYRLRTALFFFLNAFPYKELYIKLLAGCADSLILQTAPAILRFQPCHNKANPYCWLFLSVAVHNQKHNRAKDKQPHKNQNSSPFFSAHSNTTPSTYQSNRCKSVSSDIFSFVRTLSFPFLSRIGP